MAMESPDFLQDQSLISAWRFRLAGEPGKNVAVQGFEQEFIIVEFACAEIADFGIDETAQQEIHFPHAAMPGAEQNAPLPGGKHQDFRLRARHESISEPETIRPRRTVRKSRFRAHIIACGGHGKRVRPSPRERIAFGSPLLIPRQPSRSS